jgi:hypothetical protein
VASAESRYNFELYTLCKKTNMTAAIRIGRLHRAGHVQSMEEKRMPRISGKRKVGRRKSRGLDEGNGDASKQGIRAWLRRTLDIGD